MSRYSYYPGCSLHATAREYDESIQALAGPLGLELREIDEWCCCGATPAHAIDPKAATALGMWNLAHAARGGPEPILTGCASCFSRLRAVRSEVQADPQAAREAMTRMGVQPAPAPEIVHIAQVLTAPDMREKLKSLVVRPLKGLRVACYYGCLLTRPRADDALDDAENPTILEDLVRLTGAEAVDWPLRLDCCGASMTLARADLVHELCGRLLVMAHERGAHCLMVACPLCHSNLDFQQDACLRARGHEFRMPVVYLTQLIGLALGIAGTRLGLERHFVPVRLDQFLSAEEAPHA